MRISATQLESFRLFRQPDQEWMPESDLIATIRGQVTPNPAMELGSAFGLILESPDTYRIAGGYACKGYLFDHRTMVEPLALVDRRGVFEAKAVKQYGRHEVSSKADHLLGADLGEFKTTTSSFNADKYLDSCQWRFMVDAFEPRRVTYHVFLLNDHGNGVVEVRGIETLRVYPYPQCHADCADLVREFADYATGKGLADILERRQFEAA